MFNLPHMLEQHLLFMSVPAPHQLLSYLLSADTFLGDFFLSLGSERSCSKPLLSRSWRMAMLASCSASLKVSLMLRKTEKTYSLTRVLTLITSGSRRVALFSSWVISAQRTTSLAKNCKKTWWCTDKTRQSNGLKQPSGKDLRLCQLSPWEACKDTRSCTVWTLGLWSHKLYSFVKNLGLSFSLHPGLSFNVTLLAGLLNR